MKIGVISDIHNNIIALDKILEIFEENNCEMVICAGDIIGIGPYPEETINRIMSVENLIAVEGNHESYLNDGMDTEKMHRNEYNYHLWEHENLSVSSKNHIKNLTKEKYLTVNNKIIYIAHYGLQGTRYKDFAKNPSQTDLDSMFKDIEADVIIFGHDHAPVHINGDAIYINPGSCGCPGRTKNITRCGILDLSENINYEQISVDYDVDIVLNKIEELDYPAKEDIKKFFFGL